MGRNVIVLSSLRRASTCKWWGGALPRAQQYIEYCCSWTRAGWSRGLRLYYDELQPASCEVGLCPGRRSTPIAAAAGSSLVVGRVVSSGQFDEVPLTTSALSVKSMVLQRAQFSLRQSRWVAPNGDGKGSIENEYGLPKNIDHLRQ